MERRPRSSKGPRDTFGEQRGRTGDDGRVDKVPAREIAFKLRSVASNLNLATLLLI